MSAERQKQVKLLRLVRKIHRLSGIGLFLFLFITGVTGLLLGWKKNSGGLILAETAMGSSQEMTDWLPIDSLVNIAMKHPLNANKENAINHVDRIEIRPEKGIVKISFKSNYKGLQMDATTGKVLKVENRNADLIEQIHDGSWVDKQLGIKNGIFKLFYTSVCGSGLIIFTITGFWLWYGPKKIRNMY